MNMADRIQYLRKSKGISQEELADKVGVSRQAVSKWESEQSTPDLEKIIIYHQQLLLLLGCFVHLVIGMQNKQWKQFGVQ